MLAVIKSGFIQKVLPLCIEQGLVRVGCIGASIRTGVSGVVTSFLSTHVSKTPKPNAAQSHVDEDVNNSKHAGDPIFQSREP